MRNRSGFKRFTAIMMALCMVFSVAVPSFASSEQNDYANHWAKQFIEKAIAEDVMKGFPDGTFRPEEGVTRAQLATMINKKLSFDRKVDSSMTLSDVPESEWFYTDIQIAIREGFIIPTKGVDSIKPNDVLSREEVAEMIAYAYKMPMSAVSTESLKQFSDSSLIVDKSGVFATIDSRLMVGYPDGTFKPKQMVKRSEAAKVLAMASRFVSTVYNKENTTYGTTTVKGDLYITGDKITVDSTVVNGNLYVDKKLADGSVWLKHVSVKGNIYVNGGGMNSVYFIDSDTGEMVVKRDDGPVRVVIMRTADIKHLKVESDATIVYETVEAGHGIDGISVDKNSDGSVTVNLKDVDVKKLDILSDNVVINADKDTTIDKLVQGKDVVNTDVKTVEGTVIGTIDVSNDVDVTGAGAVDKILTSDKESVIKMPSDPKSGETGDGSVVVVNPPSGGGGGGSSAPVTPNTVSISAVTSAGVEISQGSIIMDYSFNSAVGSVTYANAQLAPYYLDLANSTVQLKNVGSPEVVSAEIPLSTIMIGVNGSKSYTDFGAMSTAFGGFSVAPTHVKLNLKSKTIVDGKTVSNPWTVNEGFVALSSDELDVFDNYVATAPVNVELSGGTVNPLDLDSDVKMIPADGTDESGEMSGWISGSADTLKFTVTDAVGATSTIEINDEDYVSGANYVVENQGELFIVVTTTEPGKIQAVRTYVVYVSGAEPEFVFELTEGETEAQLLDYNGAGGDVVIPATYLGRPVTSIGMMTFFLKSSITSVSIPNTVESIGQQAFGSCTNLTSVTMPNSLSNLQYEAFLNCNNLVRVIMQNSNVLNDDGPVFTGSDDFITKFNASGAGTYTRAVGGNVWYKEGFYFERCNADGSHNPVNGNYSKLTWYVGNESIISIPSTYDGRDVVAIDNNAFDGKTTITSVTIPDTVVYIALYSFIGCSNLETVNMGDGVALIDDSAFRNCTKLSSIVLPEGLTHIGNNAFKGCVLLESIEMPASLEAIGIYAFEGSSKLTTIVMKGASVHVSSGVIDDVDNFLTTYSAGGAGTYTRAEGGNVWTKSVPATDFIFIGCNANGDNNASGSYLKVTGYMGTGGVVTIPSTYDGKTVVAIDDYTFMSKTAITSMIIPDTVVFMGIGAFEGCNNLEDVSIGTGLVKISNGAFRDCIKLSSVSLSEGLKDIEGFAFSGCVSLESIEIPATINALWLGAFENTTALTTVIMKRTDASVHVSVMGGADDFRAKYLDGGAGPYTREVGGLVWTKLLPVSKFAFERVQSDGVTLGEFGTSWRVKGYNGSSGDVEIPSTYDGKPVVSIAENAFSGKTYITSVVIPNSVLFMGDNVFDGCSNLESVSIGTSLTKISNGAFRGCTNLSSVSLSEGLEEIGWHAFRYCDSLVSIEMPSTVATIDYYALECADLTTIVMNSTGASVHVQAVDNNDDFATKYWAGGAGTYTRSEGGNVWTKTLTALEFEYRIIDASYNADALGNFVEITGYNGSDANVVIPETIDGKSVISIGDFAFQSKNSITSVNLPTTVTRLGINAFNECYNLNDINLENVKVYGMEALRFNDLIEITLGNNITEMGSGVFAHNNKLTTVNWGTGLTRIEEGTFYGCTKLVNVVIPEGVNYVGLRAFQGCASLESINFPTSIRTLDGGVLDNCDSLVRIVIPYTGVDMSEFIIGDFHSAYTSDGAGEYEFDGSNWVYIVQ